LAGMLKLREVVIFIFLTKKTLSLFAAEVFAEGGFIEVFELEVF